MNLTSVKYQDSCIYIGLDGSQEQGFDGKSLEGIKNVYAVYKIKACNNYVQDTILIRKKDIVLVQAEMIVKFELHQLHRPDECEIEIVSLKFIYNNGIREELKVNESYSFLEIREYPPVVSSKKNSFKKYYSRANQANKTNKPPLKSLSVTQEVIVLPFEEVIKEEVKEEKSEEPIVDELLVKKEDNIASEKDNTHNDQDGVITIEKDVPLSTVVSEVETKVERKLDAQTNKLEMDIQKLCFETIDTLLTVLPQPVLGEEYRASSAMVRSIHRYINADLLQQEHEEGERA